MHVIAAVTFAEMDAEAASANDSMRSLFLAARCPMWLPVQMWAASA